MNTMCAGYTVDANQDPNGYDMLLTVPLPPAGFQSIHLEVDGLQSQDMHQRARATTCFACAWHRLTILDQSAITIASSYDALRRADCLFLHGHRHV